MSDNDRYYLTSHPWISFGLDLKNAPFTLWLLLGAAESKCKHLAGIPLRPEKQEELNRVSLEKGVHATTAIEGNTLSEDDVVKISKGTHTGMRAQIVSTGSTVSWFPSSSSQLTFRIAFISVLLHSAEPLSSHSFKGAGIRRRRRARRPWNCVRLSTEDISMTPRGAASPATGGVWASLPRSGAFVFMYS